MLKEIKSWPPAYQHVESFADLDLDLAFASEREKPVCADLIERYFVLAAGHKPKLDELFFSGFDLEDDDARWSVLVKQGDNGSFLNNYLQLQSGVFGADIESLSQQGYTDEQMGIYVAGQVLHEKMHATESPLRRRNFFHPSFQAHDETTPITAQLIWYSVAELETPVYRLDKALTAARKLRAGETPSAYGQANLCARIIATCVFEDRWNYPQAIERLSASGNQAYDFAKLDLSEQKLKIRAAIMAASNRELVADIVRAVQD